MLNLPIIMRIRFEMDINTSHTCKPHLNDPSLAEIIALGDNPAASKLRAAEEAIDYYDGTGQRCNWFGV